MKTNKKTSQVRLKAKGVVIFCIKIYTSVFLSFLKYGQKLHELYVMVLDSGSLFNAVMGPVEV